MSNKKSNRATIRLPNDVSDILDKYEDEHKINRTEAIHEAIHLLENPSRPVVKFQTVAPKASSESEEHYRELRALIDGLKQSFSENYIDASQNEALLNKMTHLTTQLDANIGKIDKAILATLLTRLSASHIWAFDISKLDIAIKKYRMAISSEQAQSGPNGPSFRELNEFFSVIGFSDDQIKRRSERREQHPVP